MGYKGQVAEIPLGQTGLTGTQNLTLARPTDLLVANNITYEHGVLEKEGGARIYNVLPVLCPETSALATIIAGFDWWPDSDTQRSVIATDCGDLWKDSGVADDLNVGFVAPLPFLRGLSLNDLPRPSYQRRLKKGLKTGPFAPMFFECGKEEAARKKKLVYLNGFNIPQVLKGDAGSTYDIGDGGIAVPDSALATLVAEVGAVDNGTHSYVVTYVNSFGETTPSVASNVVTTDAGHGKISVSNIPVFAGIGVGSKKLYRTKAAGTTYYLVTTLGRFVTNYLDNIADGSLGAETPPVTNTAKSRPVDWRTDAGPLCGTLHEGRVWIAGNRNSPHTIYYSTIDDHENFAEGGIMVVYPGEGQTIVGVLSFKGGLVVWKYPFGVYFILTSDPDQANWRTTRITDRIGLCSPLGASLIENDVIWMDASANIQVLSATLNYGNMSALNLSQKAFLRPFLERKLNLSGLKKVVSGYYAAARQLHFACAGFGKNINTVRLVVDFMIPENPPRFKTSDRDVCPSLWIRQSNDLIARPVIGDDTGQVWLLEQPDRIKGIFAYTGYFQTPHLDMSHASPELAVKNKIGQFLEVVMDSNSDELIVDLLWDGKFYETVRFKGNDDESPPLGEFIVGTDILAISRIISLRRRIGGQGRRLSIIGRNSVGNKSFSISKMFLHFIPGDERTS